MNYEKVPNCRVLAVSDEPIRLCGIRYILQTPVKSSDDQIVLNFQTLGVASPEEAILAHKRTPCDVLLLSVRVRTGKTTRMISKILLACPDVRIIVVADYLERDDIAAAIRGGAIGYIDWGVDHEELRDKVREVYHKTGNVVYSGRVALIMVKDKPVAYGSKSRYPCGITERELQVLQMIADENTNDQIAHLLDISPRTSESHRKNAYRKLKVKSVAGAVCKMYEYGLRKPNGPEDDTAYSDQRFSVN